MRHLLILFTLALCLFSCGSTKNKVVTKKRNYSTNKTKADLIVNAAKSYTGVKYKWGGTTRKGMDCSGLIYESFKANNIQLPRVSRDMAKRGRPINLKQVKKGDLLFFKVAKKQNSINHVGLVTNTKNNNITFIHATSSRGVITSLLSQKYWENAFYQARRVL